ncbi:MAG: HAMP domain-containing protein [Magnetococcales bacterium]|nr:HAMP domain-containing protein [Magnetococcales bacterium]
MVFIFLNMLLIEKRIESYYAISRLNDVTLEARRFEKNYFLYHDQGDIVRSLAFVAKAQEIIRDEAGLYDQSWLLKISELWLRPFEKVDYQYNNQSDNRNRIFKTIYEYNTLLTQLQLGYAQAQSLQASIRTKGQIVTEIVEQLNLDAVKHIQALFRAIKWVLVFLLAAFLIATIIATQFMVQSVTNPLRSLETSMNRISSGNFSMLPILPRQDDEIRSMHLAFNRMLEELFEHRREIVRSEKLASLGTMLAGIAHEINNPLSNISTSAELLLSEMSGADLELKNRLINHVIAETDRTRDIVRTVLEFSREQCSTKSPTHLLSTINDALLLIHGKMSKTQVDIRVDMEHTVFANRQQLQQVFINLLKNAVEAMEMSGGLKKISIISKEMDDGFLEIGVTDTGPGLSSDSFQIIFDPFHTTKDPGKGTGLGLFITHQIIDEHGGKIRVESKAGQGATFKIKLPIGDATHA